MRALIQAVPSRVHGSRRTDLQQRVNRNDKKRGKMRALIQAVPSRVDGSGAATDYFLVVVTNAQDLCPWLLPCFFDTESELKDSLQDHPNSKSLVEIWVTFGWPSDYRNAYCIRILDNKNSLLFIPQILERYQLFSFHFFF